MDGRKEVAGVGVLGHVVVGETDLHPALGRSPEGVGDHRPDRVGQADVIERQDQRPLCPADEVDDPPGHHFGLLESALGPDVPEGESLDRGHARTLPAPGRD